MVWKIIDTGVSSAEENMRWDALLLEHAEEYAQPVLHFYEWQGLSATYGYFIRPEEFLDLEYARQYPIDFARRPTGGGIVFHLWDMAFSVMVPATCPEFSQNTLENYNFVNTAVLGAVKELFFSPPPLFLTSEDLSSLDGHCKHFCMAKPTKYDVMWEGRKVAGASQRKTRKGFLHQGTIALCLPDEKLLKGLLLPGSKVAEAMQLHTCPLLGVNPTPEEIQETKLKLKALLATHLTHRSSIMTPSRGE